MGVAIVTGSAGLVGADTVRHFASMGLDVVGIDNDMRAYFFGQEASTTPMQLRIQQELGKAYVHHSLDIRDGPAIETLFRSLKGVIEVVIHTAAQPSHDWAAREPLVDFSVNAVGTLNLLEATRKHAPDAPFIFTSTNKVYGDSPNRLPLEERETRWELPDHHPYALGIPESFAIDQSLHSLFGASKVAADVLVQEYGRYFGMKTASFRGGCLTGPGHAGAELHGFLAYLMKCTATGRPYKVFGHKGKQVRDNIHSSDLVRSFEEFHRSPQEGEVYNIGGGRESNCSMIEAITYCQEIAARELDWTYVDTHRVGDHMWWISDVSRFKSHYPAWKLEYGVEQILEEIFEYHREDWLTSARS